MHYKRIGKPSANKVGNEMLYILGTEKGLLETICGYWDTVNAITAQNFPSRYFQNVFTVLYNSSTAGANIDKFSTKDEEECTKFAIIS